MRGTRGSGTDTALVGYDKSSITGDVRANVLTDIVLAVLLCFEAIAVAITFSDLNENVRIVAGVASFAGGMSCFFTSVLACVTLSQSPRKTIEAELRIALNKGIPQQS
jgi:hypothetical protein